MDLQLLLPGFSTQGFNHIIPPLERRRVSVADIVGLDPVEVSKRGRVPTGDARRLADRLIDELNAELKPTRPLSASPGQVVQPGKGINATDAGVESRRLPVGPLSKETQSSGDAISPIFRHRMTNVEPLSRVAQINRAAAADAGPEQCRPPIEQLGEAAQQNENAGAANPGTESFTLPVGSPSKVARLQTAADISSAEPAKNCAPLEMNTISTLDPAIDALLGGGIPTRYVTEVTGESGTGKTQFLLNLCLAVQLPKPQGLKRRAIYISTEHPLATSRLSQLLESHPAMSSLPPDEKPTLENILSINTMDLETQEHIAEFQLPLAVERYDVGLVIIDSITSNYRGEHSNTKQSLMKRARHLRKMGKILRNLTFNHDVAVVVANQVYDRFEPKGGVKIPRIPPSTQKAPEDRLMPTPSKFQSTPASQGSRSPYTISASPYHSLDNSKFDGSYLIQRPRPASNGLLTLPYQERFFTGWGDGRNALSKGQKVPALGLVWATRIACRIALKKEVSYVPNAPETNLPHPPKANTNTDPDSIAMPAPPPRISLSGSSQPLSSSYEAVTRRVMKLAFCSWSGGLKSASKKSRPGKSRPSPRIDEIEFEITKDGLRGKTRGKKRRHHECTM